MIYTVADLFAGAGGLSMGFAINAAFQVQFANEIDPDAAQTYAFNHPGVPMYACDIRKINKRRIQSDLGISDIDVLVGGPPCQAYSTAGKRLLSDKRAALFKQYFKVLKEFRPQVFLFENVVGLLSIQDGELFKRICILFEKEDYNVDFAVLNAVDYGVPQIRKRVILVGTRDKRTFVFPESHMAANHPTLRTALSDLPEQPGTNYERPPQNIFQQRMRGQCRTLLYHDAPSHGENLLRIIEALPEGGTVKDLPTELQPSSGFGNSYARLRWDQPSPTITRNFGTPSSARCIHPSAHRALTTREGARLQSFPDSYVFFGSRTSKNLQIGNAVPPLLAEILAQSVKTYLDSIQEAT